MATTTNPAAADGSGRIEVDDDRASNLRRWNVAMGLLHLVSAAVMLALTNDFAIGVLARYPQGPPGSEQFVDVTLFGFPLGYGTAAFLLLSALFHGIIATVGFARYRDELSHGRNRFRWVEYALSSTLMIVLIGLLNITELAALLGLAGCNVAMILFGWVMEMVNRPGDPVWWAPFTFGSIVGLVPWIALVVYLLQPGAPAGGQGPPGFVYAIVLTIFLFFNSFAVNQWAQYARVGRWSDYLVGEKTYQVLSLAAKSALAWQIFANVLVG